MVIYNICGTYLVFFSLHVSLVCFHCHCKRYHTFKINAKIKPVKCYTDIQVLKYMQHFVKIVCANLQHAKHRVMFCFSLKMASAHGREVSCACSFTKLTELLLHAPQSPNKFFEAADGWWHLNVYGLYLQQCLFQKSIEFRQNTEYNGSPYFCFYPFHLFSQVLHMNEFSLHVQLMNSQLKKRSPWWKRDAHIHLLSHYITAYRTESRKWITGFNKEETGLTNTPTFMQSKIRALPQH